MYHLPDHPEIRAIEQTGYPSWMNDEEPDGRDYDFEYESRREEELLRGLD